MIPRFINWKHESLILYHEELGRMLQTGELSPETAADRFTLAAQEIGADWLDCAEMVRALMKYLPPRPPGEPPRVIVIDSIGVMEARRGVCVVCGRVAPLRDRECPDCCH